MLAIPCEICIYIKLIFHCHFYILFIILVTYFMAEILFISHRIPYPPNKGDKIRAFQMIQNLKTLGHTVSCAFPIDEQSDYSYAQQLKNICETLIYPKTIYQHIKNIVMVSKPYYQIFP